MIDKVSSDNCILCGNCKLVCPTNAIEFNNNLNGFLYPEINKNKCINCNKCENYCPELHDLSSRELLSSYAVKNRNLEIRKNSSSGGFFSALCESILSGDGVAIGASYDYNYKRVVHTAIDKIENVYKLRGSKYVQSSLGNIFEEVKKYLEMGKKVLFSGCPCQCAALNTYLNNKKISLENLYIVDFICHGILSEQLYLEYINYLEKKFGKIESFDFRNKDKGWIESGPKITFSNGKVVRWPLYKDIYMQGYFKALAMRNSCYHCKYKNFKSGSDITMGDFWGAEMTIPDFYDNYGVSAITVQSEKGKKLFEAILKYLEIKEVDISLIIKYNKGLVEAFSEGKYRDEYLRISKKHGCIKSLKRFSKSNKKEQLKRVYVIIKNKLKNN